MTARDVLFAIVVLAGVVLMCVALLAPASSFDGARQQCVVSFVEV